VGDTLRLCERSCTGCEIEVFGGVQGAVPAARARRLVNDVATHHGENLAFGQVRPEEIIGVVVGEVAIQEGFCDSCDGAVVAASAALGRIAGGGCTEYTASDLISVSQIS